MYIIYDTELYFFWRIFSCNTSGPVARPPNKRLYRSGLDPLSATNLCYGNYISYTESDFLILFFKNYSVLFEAYASIIIFFSSGVKPRSTASSSKP